jgi:hypothetical protein
MPFLIAEPLMMVQQLLFSYVTLGVNSNGKALGQMALLSGQMNSRSSMAGVMLMMAYSGWTSMTLLIISNICRLEILMTSTKPLAACYKEKDT